MTPFVDIHTHKSCRSDTTISLKSCFLEEYTPDTTPPFSIGIHPWHVTHFDSNQIDFLKNVLVQSGAAAIGECGLDRTKNDFEKQILFFEAQLQLAEELNIPVIIHAVKAYDQLLLFRKKYHETPWIVHGFTGNSITANSLIKQNIFLSFGVKLLEENSKLCTAFIATPLHALFLETDEADIAISTLYEQAAQLKKVSEKKIKEAIFLNYKSCFKYQ